MIVMHENRRSPKSNQKDITTVQIPTAKSILSENDPNIMGKKKVKLKIYNEDNQI
jgi:hypothetical protein